MTTKSKQFKASLIKYRSADMKDAIWFWVNPTTGSTLSPEFKRQEDAEKWFDDVIKVHQETYNFMERCKSGKFFLIRGKVDVGDVISSKKANDCPFDMHLEDDIMVFEILGLDENDAKARVEEYFEILEWLNDN
jgi:hypothetical protein